MKSYRGRAMLSWIFVSALLILCGVLGFLQYRWIGEVTAAARERLRGSLEASLNRFSREFNSEISAATWAVVPANAMTGSAAVETAVAANYQAWQKTGRHTRIFSRIAIAEPGPEVNSEPNSQPSGSSIVLKILDLNTGSVQKTTWPEEWSALRDRLMARIGPGPRRTIPETASESDGTRWEIPIFGNGASNIPRLFPRPGFGGQRGPGERRFGPPREFGPPDGTRGGRGSGDRPGDRGEFAGAPRDRRGLPAMPDRPPAPREVAWVILELNTVDARETVLPELLQRDLADYDAEVLTKAHPPTLIYQSEPNEAKRVSASADGTVSLLMPTFDSRSAGRGPGPGPGPGPVPQQGRWELFVRHRAGSLETVVAQLRRRDLAVTGSVLVLLFASLVALVRYTRRAQRLAQLQIDFVAGISHELRTPLTVIHTAGYNLRGKMAQNPAQVERYGALIQQESGRLTELVEQIMRFAGTEAGSVIREPEPLSIESVIHDTVESSRSAFDQAHCVVEQTIDPGLPLIMGDPTALHHALLNLLTNAAKYGTKGSNWIGVFASKAYERGRTMVEIRVADRGPAFLPTSRSTSSIRSSAAN